MYSLTRTPAFRAFRRRVGNSTFHINSAYIGLEWIARGNGKPDGLDIAWTPPKDPKQSVDQTRSLLSSAMLSHVFDALDTYLRALADESWLKLRPEQRDILCKSVTKPNKEAYSITDRFLELGLELDVHADTDMAMVAALVTWRNQETHSGRSRPGDTLRLDEGFKERLKAERDAIGERYGGLDPTTMLCHMHQRCAPKRKEVVGLVSACQNLVRAADGTLLRAALRSVADVEAVARAKIGATLCEGMQHELRRLWGKDVIARGRRLHAILQEAGFSTSSEAGSPRLPSDFVNNLANLPRHEASRMFGHDP